MITTILFDLDGTLLPMHQDTFVAAYFGALAEKLAENSYDKEEVSEVILKGMRAMMKNTGTDSNETLFWRVFEDTYGKNDALRGRLFAEFYEKDFPHVQKAVGFAKEAKEVIDLCKARGFRCVLATNPMFPKAATYQRVCWAGLSLDDFAMISTYEEFTRCKPNPEFFKELLGKLSLCPEECVMVGNDAYEDTCAMALGIPVFLLTHSLVNRKNADLSEIPHGDFADLKAYIEALNVIEPR